MEQGQPAGASAQHVLDFFTAMNAQPQSLVMMVTLAAKSAAQRVDAKWMPGGFARTQRANQTNGYSR